MSTGESRRRRLASEEHPHPTKDMKKNRLFNGLLILVAFALTSGFIAFGSYFQSGESLQGIAVGYPSSVNILAPRDVENTEATARERLAAEIRAAELPRIMSFDHSVWPRVEFNLRLLEENLNDVRAYYARELEAFERVVRDAETEYQAQRLIYDAAFGEWEAQRDLILAQEDTDIDDVPPPPEEPPPPETMEPYFQVWAMFEFLSVRFNENQQALLVSMDDYNYRHFWTIIMDVAYTMQATDIAEITSITLDIMRDYLGAWALDQETRYTIETIITEFLSENLVENTEATQLTRDSIARDYEPVMILEGASIVRIGEIVDLDMYTILYQLGMLGDTTMGDIALSIVGAIFIVALLFMACAMYLSFYRPTVAAIKREAFLLFTLYVLVITFVWLLSDFPYPFLPILIFPMLVSVLIERRSAVVLTFAITTISYLIVAGSWDFLMFFLVSGLVIAMLSRFTTDRNKIFLVGIAVSVIQFALSVSISFILDLNLALYSIPDLLTTAAFAAFNGLLTVIISTGSLPIWETFFGVVTPVKLLDLTNPTNLLLRRLTIEAPGTYHHSLIVANLAETAAYDIGANAHAARVGGYYHDVGKLKYPQYFAENLDGDNPHDHLDPSDSARLIISHVTYGLTLATEHRLPQFVRDIIQEHHGNSLLQFFYHKAVESKSQVDEKDYRYPYTIPQTRESACVMLADSVEAAIRAMMSKLASAEEVEKAIQGIIRSKLNDGQLADSQLSLRDVAIIEQSFVRVLKGMYHERIPYPKLIPVGDAESIISASSED